jgi:hypothetical protein
MHAVIMRTLASLLAAASLLSISAAARAQAPGASLAASSEDDAGPQDSFTTNPFWDLLGGANLAYERAFGRHFSIMVAGLFLDAHGTNSDGNEANATIASLTVQPHFYFGKRSLEGAYIAPFVELLDVAVSDSGGNAVGGSGVMVGATIGYSWLLGPVNLKLGVGAQVAEGSMYDISSDGTSAQAKGLGAGLAMDLGMGFAF